MKQKTIDTFLRVRDVHSNEHARLVENPGYRSRWILVHSCSGSAYLLTKEGIIEMKINVIFSKVFTSYPGDKTVSLSTELHIQLHRDVIADASWRTINIFVFHTLSKKPCQLRMVKFQTRRYWLSCSNANNFMRTYEVPVKSEAYLIIAYESVPNITTIQMRTLCCESKTNFWRISSWESPHLSIGPPLFSIKPLLPLSATNPRIKSSTFSSAYPYGSLDESVENKTVYN